MSLVAFQTRKVKDALKVPATVGLDLVILLVVLALAGAVISFGRQATGIYRQQVDISLSYWALPKYTLFSLSRGVAAYMISLVFTLIYGTVAAHNRRAEKVMVPALDVLQSIPVLSFLPLVVLAMISLFPTRQIGLEIACIVMIFTAQAWNMTFSFYGSVRSIPQPLREVTKIHRLGWWKVFRILEVPAAMIGLVWNSMMSMAGGWFVLNISESFKLQDRDFRLPGIGSYMSEAVAKNDRGAMVAAVVAMIVMIVAVDQFIWRPIVVWSERFKVEDTSEANKPQSWVLNLLRYSRIWAWAFHLITRVRTEKEDSPTTVSLEAGVAPPTLLPTAPSYEPRRWKQNEGSSSNVRRVAGWMALAFLTVAAAWGAWTLFRLLAAVPMRNPATHEDWATVGLALLASFGRTTAAVLIGAAWTLPVGILIGLSPKWSQRLQPIIQVVASFPAPMIFPVIVGVMALMHIPFGIGCISLMLLGTQWYILFNVIAGAMAIPSDLKEVSRVYRTPKIRLWLRLYIPCVFPYLVTGLVTAAGGAWNATIVSEYAQLPGDKIIFTFGLGSMISQATDKGNFPMLAAAVVTMAVTVVFLNRLIWKRLFRLAENRYSLNM